MDENMKKTEQTEEKQPLTVTQKQFKKIKRSEKSVKDYQFFVLKLAGFLLVLWVLFFVLIGIMRVPGADMYPRLDSGDMILFYRLDKDVRAQDVIVVEKEVPTLQGEQLMVLRVVAVAGDTVEISDSNSLVINGNTMIESNIFYPTPRYEGFTEYPLTLGEGECFVLADSRNGGTDSRFFGPVTRDEILGTVITVVRRNNL